MTKLRNYESDTTTFIRDFLAQNPQVVEKQKSHRATWWDRPQNLDERRKLEAAQVPQTGLRVLQQDVKEPLRGGRKTAPSPRTGEGDNRHA